MKMEQTKDYSLLRPFDLEAAKRGARVAWARNGDEGVLIGGPDCAGHICIDWEGNGEKYGLRLYDRSGRANLRMAPLCWVEGRPVYKGDVLYHSKKGKFEVTGIFSRNAGNSCGPSFSWADEESGLLAYACTWTPPKVKREGWVNIYRWLDDGARVVAHTSHAFVSEEEASKMATPERIACLHIEWEE